jgi:putative phage-type endonuclease
MKQIPKPTHGSLQWLETRHKHEGKTIIGASEAPIIMGCNDYKNIIDLAIEKMQPPEVREANNAMKRGTFLEDGLLRYAEAELQLTVETPDVMYLNGRIIATLDGMASDGRLIECKTTTKWVENEPCLPEWYWQAHAQMICTGTNLVTFCVLDRQLRISLFDVEYSEEDAQTLITAAQQFCESIDAGELPTDQPLTAKQVSVLHPEPAGEVEIGMAGLEKVQMRNALKEQIKLLEAQETQLADEIADLMRGNDIGTIDGQKVITYKKQTTSRFAIKEFTTAHPDLAKQFMKQTSFRVLRTVKGAI